VATDGTRTSALRRFLDERLLPYLPTPHFMMVAPLDAILRLLFRPPARIPWPYWPRLALIVLVSAMSTIASLPERIVTALWLRFRPPPIPPHQAPVFVLGYFRSGTTFLESLLAADPMMRSPLWAEVLAPQAYVVGWVLLRYLLIPFLPLTRMDDVVPLAPGLPAEDDFAVCNWGVVSIIAGRAVLPQAQPFYDRFHDLDRLSADEFDRWRRTQRAFVEKLMLSAGGRRLLLKSPSHTARVRHLLKLFPGAKFVHISRPPEVVFQSNLMLARSLQSSFALQPPIAADAQEEIAAAEYLATEEHYLADRALVPAGDLAEVRLQDLAADPIGEMRRIYRDLGLPFSRVYERRLAEVLNAPRRRTPNVHPPLTEAQRARAARLAPLATAFGHDRPAIARVPAPPSAPAPERPVRAAGASLLAAVAGILAWYGFYRLVGADVGWVLWPLGVAIGFAARAAGGTRTAAVAVLAAALVPLSAVPYAALVLGLWPLDADAILAAAGAAFTLENVFWALVGGTAAWWIASGRPA
jgi:hypothetical protein